MRRVFRWHAALFTTVALIAGCDDNSGPTATPSKGAAVTAAPDADGGGAVKSSPKRKGGRSAKGVEVSEP